MLTESPFSTRQGTLDALRKQGVVPVASAADAAELVAAILLLDDAVSYDDLRSELNALRDQDDHLNRDLLTVGITVDTILEKLTTCRIVKAEPDGRLVADDEVAVGWLGGRGIVRFIKLLRTDTPPAVAWADALSKLAWRHQYREARTGMARQMIDLEMYEEIDALCDWLHAHCKDDLDDLSQTLRFCLWQFSVEILNAGRPDDPHGFARWATATLRFATVKHGQLFPLLGLPPQWSRLLNETSAKVWEQVLFEAIKHDDPAVQGTAWAALKSHCQLTEQCRIRLADISNGATGSGELAAAVLSIQLPRDDESLSISRVVDGLASDEPQVVRRCLSILLARINQPGIQHYVQSGCRPYAKSDIVFKMAHQILRAADLNQQTLDALVEIVLKRPAWYAEQACQVLLAQHELSSDTLGKLEVNDSPFQMIAFMFAFKHRAHLMLRFGSQVTPFKFPYGMHARSYRPDPLVGPKPNFFIGRQHEYFDSLFAALTLDDCDPNPQRVIDAFVSARVLATATCLPVERFGPLLANSTPLQRAVVERALLPHLTSSDGNVHTLMKYDRQIVASSLAAGTNNAVFAAAPDRLRPMLRRVLKSGWQYVTADDFRLGTVVDGELFEIFDRVSLTLDDALRGAVLSPSTTELDNDDAPTVGVDPDRPVQSELIGGHEATAEVGPTGFTPELYQLLYQMATDVKRLSETAQRSSGTAHHGRILSGAPQLDDGSNMAMHKYHDITAHIDPAQQLQLDEESFRSHIEWLYLHHFGGQPSRDAFGFFYFIAWSYEHMELSPEYDAIAGKVEPDVVELLPETLRTKALAGPYKSGESLGKAIRRTFKEPSFEPIVPFLFGGLFR